MRRNTGDHVLAAIPLAWLAVLFLVPLGFTLVYSFGTAGFGTIELGFSLDNYAQALGPLYLETFVRTVAFAVGSSALCLVFAYPIAYAIARRSGRFKVIAFALILVPYLASLLIRVMSWQILLAQGGPLERMLRATGLLHSPLTILDSLPAVIVGTIAVYLPIAVIALTVVLDRIPSEVIEASQDLGASGAATFWTVIVPLSRPGIATAALLTAVPMLGELVIPVLLGGNKGLFLSQAISSQYVQSQNYALGSAMVVLLVLAIAVVVGLLVRLTRGFDAAGAEGERG
ncbi:ABC transporter permease [Humibacter albus]|uniref:ABC transporter permease n=1 Tax=Humibacter albus TaxID=427754 RepID=UPI0003B6DFB8|nr:ABC transporter permease [Humibacter albus]